MEEDKGMNELREIAKAYYDASTSDVKDLATKFFKSLDNDGNDQVSLPEFLEYMRVEGHPEMRNRDFFSKLDKDKNGTLDFMEVMSLYYILKSGRPFCSACSDFITGMFFACTKCFDSDTEHPFCVCLTCYGKRDYVHEHKHFLDNYAILEFKRKSTIADAKAKAEARAKAREDERNRSYNHSPSMSSSSTVTQSSQMMQRTPTRIFTTAIVPYRENNNRNNPHWVGHLAAFTTRVATNMCTLM